MPSSFISSSELGPGQAHRWRRMLCVFVMTLAGLSTFVYGFVVLVDPYDTLPFSPDFEREPISTNARFSFPALAAKPDFDSAVFGTSTSRLLRPIDFDPLFGTRFVNLAMNSATAYEQQQIFNLFVYHHPRPKMVVVGLDAVWCDTNEAPARFTFRPFPPWLYDLNPWNDMLHLFNRSAVEQAGRQAARALGLRAPKYGLDGYTNFLPPRAEYDIEKARHGLYGDAPPRRREIEKRLPGRYDDYRAELRFTTHGVLTEMLGLLPPETVKLLFFVPYHHFHQPAPGSEAEALLDECKQRIADVAKRHDNAFLIDFMISSAITLEDSNYWDPLHFDTRVATQLVGLFADALGTQNEAGTLYRLLAGSWSVDKTPRSAVTDDRQPRHWSPGVSVSELRR